MPGEDDEEDVEDEGLNEAVDDGAEVFTGDHRQEQTEEVVRRRKKISLALTLMLTLRGRFDEVCDASEQQETALKTIESASTFASTFAFSSGVDTDKTIVFTGHFESDSDQLPVFRLCFGTSIKKVLILKGIIEVERVKGIESARISPPFS